MKKIIVAPLMLMALNTFALADIPVKELKKMDQNLTEAKKSLPLKVPNTNMTVREVIRDNETIIYRYSVDEDITDIDAQEKILENGRSALCVHDKNNLNLGFKNKYIYTYKNGVVVENNVSKEICSQL